MAREISLLVADQRERGIGGHDPVHGQRLPACTFPSAQAVRTISS